MPNGRKYLVACRDYVMTKVAYLSGVRAAELCGVCMGDLHWDHGQWGRFVVLGKGAHGSGPRRGVDPQWAAEDALPFEASRGYASATGEDADGARPWWSRERRRSSCRRAGGDEATAADTARTLAWEGLRVLAVAVRGLNDEVSEEALDRPLDEPGPTSSVSSPSPTLRAATPRRSSPACRRRGCGR